MLRYFMATDELVASMGRTSRQINGRDTLGRYRATRYAFAQTSPVFGSIKHMANQPRPKFKRQYLYPQARTLAKHKPNLFSAIKLAQDKAVSDNEFIHRLPRSNNYVPWTGHQGHLRTTSEDSSSGVPKLDSD